MMINSTSWIKNHHYNLNKGKSNSDQFSSYPKDNVVSGAMEEKNFIQKKIIVELF